MDRDFTRSQITAVRHEVDALAASAGLTRNRRDGFVLAVNEIITNVVLHAGGTGRVRLVAADGAVQCVISDTGAGIPERHLTVESVPPAFAVGGRGIWLAYQLCDFVAIETGPDGTVVELRAQVPALETAADLGEREDGGETNRRSDVQRSLDG